MATALVGTGADAERIDVEAAHLVEMGLLVELGRDQLSQPIYSTAAQIAIAQNLLALAECLLEERRIAPAEERVADLCRARGLSDEQLRAVHAATTTAAVVIIEGTAGTGKTTMLAPVVAAYRDAGMRVIGTATAWKIATQLKDDLGIQSKATDAWIASANAGGEGLDRNSVLIVGEAGLLSSRQMHDLLVEVERAGAKAVLVGERRQRPAVGAGPGLAILASVTDQPGSITSYASMRYGPARR